MKHVSWLVAIIAAVAGPAMSADLNRSTDGYSYFHRAGADRATHDRAIWECRLVARQLRQEVRLPTGTPVLETVVDAAGWVGGKSIAEAVFQQIEDSKRNRVNVENCMVAMGWDVVVIDPAEAKSLRGEALQDALDAWIGAPSPHGVVARTFRNDATLRGTTLYSPPIKRGVSLSLNAVGAPTPVQGAAILDHSGPYLPRPSRGARPTKLTPSMIVSLPLGIADLNEPPADDRALVAVQINDEPALTLSFEQVGRDGEVLPPTVAGPPRRWGVTSASDAGASLPGRVQIFALPAGRWRLASATVYGLTLSFCLGGPGFDAAAGDVLYAGAFSFDRLVPDMDLTAARRALPAGSISASKLKSVAWLNGMQGSCSGNLGYVLELPGHAFAPAYAFGSHAAGAGAAADGDSASVRSAN